MKNNRKVKRKETDSINFIYKIKNLPQNFSDFAETDRKKERKNSTGAGIFDFRIFILSPQSLGRERRMTSDAPRRKSLAAVPGEAGG